MPISPTTTCQGSDASPSTCPKPKNLCPKTSPSMSPDFPSFSLYHYSWQVSNKANNYPKFFNMKSRIHTCRQTGVSPLTTFRAIHDMPPAGRVWAHLKRLCRCHTSAQTFHFAWDQALICDKNEAWLATSTYSYCDRREDRRVECTLALEGKRVTKNRPDMCRR